MFNVHLIMLCNGTGLAASVGMYLEVYFLPWPGLTAPRGAPGHKVSHEISMIVISVYAM
jgi:hypothetical protein